MIGPCALRRALDRLNKDRVTRASLGRSIGDAFSVYEDGAAPRNVDDIGAYEGYLPRLLTLPQYRWFDDLLEIHVALRGGIHTAAEDGVSWTDQIHDHNHNNRYATDDVPCSHSPLVQEAIDRVVDHSSHIGSTIPDRIWTTYARSGRRVEADIVPFIIEQCIHVGNLIGPLHADRDLSQEAMDECLAQTRDGVRETVEELGGSVDRVDQNVSSILPRVSVKEILSESPSRVVTSK